MKKTRILQLAAKIEAQEGAKFDMGEWLSTHTCGTSACIGGFAILHFQSDLAEEVLEAPDNDLEFVPIVAKLLGLSHDKANALCLPGAIWLSEDSTRVAESQEVCRNSATLYSPWGATPAEAAKVLLHLAETGEVDWAKAFLKEPQK